jgi:predicted RNase H-like HicB family nuclease
VDELSQKLQHKRRELRMRLQRVANGATMEEVQQAMQEARVFHLEGLREEDMDCRDELQGALEEWLMLRLHDHLDIPDIDDIHLAIQDAT